MDPLSEKYQNSIPYIYGLNNPIFWIDPTGMSVENPGDFYDRKGNYLGNDGKKDNKLYLVIKVNTLFTTINWGGKLQDKYVKQLKEKSTEVGALIIQNRIEEGSYYTISEFKTVGGEKNVEGYMLEPAGSSTTTPNKDKRIPEGVYDIQNYSSKKYPDNFRLSNDDVSKNRQILYHSGNYGRQTECCNMPGCSKGNGSVINSVTNFEELRAFIKSEGAENVKTIINNKIPEKK